MTKVNPMWQGARGEHGDRLHLRTPAHTYLPGRICIMAECGSKLSRYNPASTCYLHTEPKPQLVCVRNGRRVSA